MDLNDETVSPVTINISTIDLHTEGEPLRVIVDGFPDVQGSTILEKRDWLMENHDHLRKALMWEPRGHADMYGALPVAPERPDSDVGVLFMHNDGYSTMCGHAIIGLVKAAIEHELVSVADPRNIRIDTPAGLVVANAEVNGSKVESVAFRNVPSFVLQSDAVVETADWGTVRVDVAYGGAFYAVVNARDLDLSIRSSRCADLIAAGQAIKAAVTEQMDICHPDGDPRLNFLYGSILVEGASPPRHSRNVCIFADGEVDRSPTGTGVSARAAILYARGDLDLGEWIEIESLIGSSFAVRVVDSVRLGDGSAVIPEVRGRAWTTGMHRFVIEPDDPLGSGFLLR